MIRVATLVLDEPPAVKCPHCGFINRVVIADPREVQTCDECANDYVLAVEFA